MGPVVQLSGVGIGALACLAVGCMAAGCGSSKAAAPDDAPDASSEEAGEAGGDEGGDADAAAIPYPAFPPDTAQILDGKGGVLDKANIVTVTFASDTYAPTWQAFDDAIVASSYWTTTTAEYGIGMATSGAPNHVVVETPPTSPWDDYDIDTWVQQMATTPSSGWPQNGSETLYVVYVPSTVQVTDSGENVCDLYGGYHSQAFDADGNNPVAFALVFTACYYGGASALVEEATETASHEIVEGVTDPDAINGWVDFSANNLAWSLWNDDQWEVADACEFFDEAYYPGTGDLPYELSRIWSNASGKAGHDPCVPVPSGAYNSVTPLGLETMAVTALIYNPDGSTSVGPYTTKGWRIAPGATATVQVGFYSDAPMDAWTVKAVEGDCCTQGWTDVLTVTPSTFSGKNGDTVSLTIKANAAPAGRTAALLNFQSPAAKNIVHFMPVVVGVY